VSYAVVMARSAHTNIIICRNAFSYAVGKNVFSPSNVLNALLVVFQATKIVDITLSRQNQSQESNSFLRYPFTVLFSLLFSKHNYQNS